MHQKSIQGYVGVYGGTSLEKHYCSECKGFYIVKSDILQCCDKRVYARPEKWKRESLATRDRYGPPVAYRKEQLSLQNYQCMYCDRTFGTRVNRKGKVVTLIIHWDHFVPYAYLQASPDRNFVAACQICNLAKSSKYFQTVEEVKIYVQSIRD